MRLDIEEKQTHQSAQKLVPSTVTPNPRCLAADGKATPIQRNTATVAERLRYAEVASRSFRDC
jgi:hypothetical protein